MSLEIRNDVIAAAKRRSQALVAGDPAALLELLTDDFAYVNAAGSLLDRAEYVRAHITSGATRWFGQDLDEFHVRVHGDWAVLICRAHDRISFEGEPPTDTHVRSTQVWRRLDDVWRCLSIHTTGIDG